MASMLDFGADLCLADYVGRRLVVAVRVRPAIHASKSGVRLLQMRSEALPVLLQHRPAQDDQ
jgi:hypothetical protein